MSEALNRSVHPSTDAVENRSTAGPQHAPVGDPAPVLHGVRASVLHGVPSPLLHGVPSRGDEYFGHQPTGSAELPDPAPLLENLTRCVIEILAGARELEQIARWVDDDVYRHLLKRVVLSTRARQVKGASPRRPAFTIGSTMVSSPRDGVVEAVVMVHSRVRARAVAFRLEGLDRRWRATAINVL